MTTATGGRKVVTFILMKISLKPPHLLWSIFRDDSRHRKTTDRKSDLFYFLARMVIRFV